MNLIFVDFIAGDLRLRLTHTEQKAKGFIQFMHVLVEVYTSIKSINYETHSYIGFFCNAQVTLCDSSQTITKTRLFKYIENFTTKKGKFSGKKF